MLEKTGKLNYSDLEKNFKRIIMEKLADVILNQTVRYFTSKLYRLVRKVKLAKR